MNPTIVQQQGERGDRAVAIGAFLVFLATGFFGEEPRLVAPPPAHRAQVAPQAPTLPAAHP
jgi:hypothetical protein